MHYETIDDIIAADGLRLVLVQGFPSPWGRAAKAMLDDALRPLFSNVPEVIRAAVDPILLAHRERFLRAHCVVPMEL